MMWEGGFWGSGGLTSAHWAHVMYGHGRDTYSTYTKQNPCRFRFTGPHTHTHTLEADAWQTNHYTHEAGSHELICQPSHIRLMEREGRWLEGRREENTPFSSWLIFPISSRHDHNLLQLKHHSGDRHWAHECVCVCMQSWWLYFIEWKIESNCFFKQSVLLLSSVGSLFTFPSSSYPSSFPLLLM